MLKRFWKKGYRPASDSLFNKLVFHFLCCLECVYFFFFRIILFYKQYKHPLTSPFFVISVGNISSGGTGKSVVTAFLLERLKPKLGAVFIRGYKGSNEKYSTSFIVDKYNKNDIEVLRQAGDEALMLAHLLNVPIVVGKNRAASSLLLERHQKERKAHYDFVILDDGYQHFSIQKDYEVLLLDARAPFENNHCLPAGPLREKNISRAHVIICTHAEKLTPKERDILHHDLFQKTQHNFIFFGHYTVKSVIDAAEKKVNTADLLSYDLVACAGIGSFLGFKETLESLCLSPRSFLEYEDHHVYSLSDLYAIQNCLKRHSRGGLITTRKDWYKLKFLWTQLPHAERFPLFCIDITFSFLTDKEDIEFFESLYQHVNL